MCSGQDRAVDARFYELAPAPLRFLGCNSVDLVCTFVVPLRCSSRMRDGRLSWVSVAGIRRLTSGFLGMFRHMDQRTREFRCFVGSVALFAVALFAIAIGAEPLQAQDIAGAGRAYQQAQQAELSEDHARAAELYELADSLAASPEALRSALRSRLRAGHNAMAAGHAERLVRLYPDDASSRELAEETLGELRPTLEKVRVSCSAACRVLVDESSATLENSQTHEFFVSPGDHEISASFQHGQADPEQITSRRGGERELAFEAPPPPPEIETAPSTAGGSAGRSPLRAQEEGGLSPWFFATGLAVSVGLAAAATATGLRTRSLHDDWEADRSNRDLYDEGSGFQLATNILIGTAGAAALTTLIFAFLTDWGGDDEEVLPVALQLGPGEMSGTFTVNL